MICSSTSTAPPHRLVQHRSDVAERKEAMPSLKGAGNGSPSTREQHPEGSAHQDDPQQAAVAELPEVNKCSLTADDEERKRRRLKFCGRT